MSEKSGVEATRLAVLNSDNTDPDRNALLKQDIEFFAKELPNKHINPFSIMTYEALNAKTASLLENVDKLGNNQVFVELNKVIAAIGDAHTTIEYTDGYNYPLVFYMFGSDAYIINADKRYGDMLYSKVKKIGGRDIDYIIEQLSTLISHENDAWLMAMMPQYLRAPVFMYGLGIIDDEQSAVFTVEKDGSIIDKEVIPLKYGEKPELCVQTSKDAVTGVFDKYYGYNYIPENKAVYFEYNVCADMVEQPFTAFNKELFSAIESNGVEKVIVDLRSNSGGNSEILNPFTQQLQSYISRNETLKVCILVGRDTFSSGMFAIYRIKEAAPASISVGEATGGALDHYGEVRTFKLPNSQIPIDCSTKYFTLSKDFTYKNKGVATFEPDVYISETFADYMNGVDAVLEYALHY